MNFTEMKDRGLSEKEKSGGMSHRLLDSIVFQCTLDSYLLGVTKHLTIALK